MALRNMPYLVADDTGQLLVGRHIIDQALEKINESAWQCEGIDFLIIEHLKRVLYILPVARRRYLGADAGHPRLQLRIGHQAVLRLQVHGDAAADLNLFLRTD